MNVTMPGSGKVVNLFLKALDSSNYLLAISTSTNDLLPIIANLVLMHWQIYHYIEMTKSLESQV